MTTFSSSSDIIDSRDIEERIQELQNLVPEESQDVLEEKLDNLKDKMTSLEEEIDQVDASEDHEGVLGRLEQEKEELQEEIEEVEEYLEAFSDLADEVEELQLLLELKEEVEGYSSEWEHGVALIRQSYFETYAQDLADDIGAIDRNANWPLNHIDWEAAADELLHDYSEVEFDGVTYYFRNT